MWQLCQLLGYLLLTMDVYHQIPWLKANAVAYLNVDVAVAGPRPDVSATPQLHEIVKEVMKKVIFPFNGSENITMYDMWYAGSEGEVGVLGSGSDYTSFVHNGIPAVRSTPCQA